MAFLNIKSASFLLIITISFSSCSCGVMAATKIPLNPKVSQGGSPTGTFPTSVPKWFTSIGKSFPPGSQKITPTLEEIFNAKIGVNSVLPSLGEQQFKMYGKIMAEWVFGTAGRKGFSWGWNGSKYYLKAAKTCANYQKSLTRRSCAQQVDKLRSLKPNCFKECVIEFAYATGGTPQECTWHDDDSCKYNLITDQCITGVLLTEKCTVTNG